jgi:hypothetical protein
MNGKAILIELGIMDLIVAKWYIAYGKIKEVVRQPGILESCNADIGARVEFPRNPAGNRV